MMRSLFAGVSGLRNHQVRMDVIGNNIANVNTVAFKKSRVNFQDMLYQNLRSASKSQGGRGGTNPMQVGLGMAVSSIDTIFTPSGAQNTGNETDLMIQGDGLFIVNDGTMPYYTRAGNFRFDTNGDLVNADGLKVQGWMADSSGTIDPQGPLTGIHMVVGQPMGAKATSKIVFEKNLNAGAAIDDPATAGIDEAEKFPITMQVYDALGKEYSLKFEFKRTGANTWTYDVTVSGGGNLSSTTGNLEFYAGDDPATVNIVETPGQCKTPNASLTITNLPSGAPDINIDLDFKSLTQYYAQSTAIGTPDGYEPGTLNSFNIDQNGIITGEFTNGINIPIAQIALAVFNNPAGLVKEGSSLYRPSNNSGNPQIGTAGTGGRGVITSSALEMSNVDLSEEFTNMIITQRGFQANSRIITSSDEMLQELVNLKR